MLLSRNLDRLLGCPTIGRVATDDGVELQYQSFGEGPAVVFANGIGVRFPGAARQAVALRGAHQVICWDYRGMGQSAARRPEIDVSMLRQARDLVAILDHLSVQRAVLVGWSMGVQVSLELIRSQPERVAGLVALLGGYGRPFEAAFPAPLALGIEKLFAGLQRRPGPAQAALDLAVVLPRVALAVLSRLLFVGPDVDPEIFAANVRSVAGVEKRLYLRTMLAMAHHDASDVLPQVRCPSLIICGERDYLTPPRVARHMAQAIPGATYREVPRGTHFALIEQPELINGWLTEFMSRVYAASPQS